MRHTASRSASSSCSPIRGRASRPAIPVDARFTGGVTNITDYGAFVELEPGIEGLIHVSEMSWTKKNVHPGKIVSTSQEVDVVILEVDPVKRRISLGLKQTLQNPWEAFAEKHPVGSEVEGEGQEQDRIRSVQSVHTSFWSPFPPYSPSFFLSKAMSTAWSTCRISTGTVPASRLSTSSRRATWFRAQVLDVDVDKERISLGIKQLAGDPFADAGEIRKGQVVTCEVVEVKDAGIDVKIVDTDLSAFIRPAPNLPATAPTSAPTLLRR